MERNIKIEAISLKKIQLGESNIGVTLLTNKNEILFVMAFGAMKSKNKLFGAVNPFVESTWDLYYDSVKKHYRAKDVSVSRYNEELHTSIEAFYTGTLLLEIILKSQGSDGVYDLLKLSLEYLKNGTDTKYLLIQFLLRFIQAQGVLPSFSHCSLCERDIEKESMFYNGDFTLQCSDCSRGVKHYELNAGMLLYCSKTPSLELEVALKRGLAENSRETLKRILIEFIKTYTGGKLLTLNSSDGLI